MCFIPDEDFEGFRTKKEIPIMKEYKLTYNGKTFRIEACYRDYIYVEDFEPIKGSGRRIISPKVQMEKNEDGLLTEGYHFHLYPPSSYRLRLIVRSELKEVYVIIPLYTIIPKGALTYINPHRQNGITEQVVTHFRLSLPTYSDEKDHPNILLSIYSVTLELLKSWRFYFDV